MFATHAAPANGRIRTRRGPLQQQKPPAMQPSGALETQTPVITGIGIAWAPGICIAPENVGLRADRPFRFCTLHWDPEALPPVPFGDDKYPTLSRLVELYMPNLPQARSILVHSHSFYELVLIRRGSAIHRVEDEEMELHRGDVMVLAPGVSHSYDHIDRLVKTNIYVQPGWFFEDLRLLWWEEGLVRHLLAIALFDLPRERRLLHMTATEDEIRQCEHELADMSREGRKSKPSLLAFHAGFLKILNVLNDAYKRSGEDFEAPLQYTVWKAAEQMETLISQGIPLRVSKMAQKLNISKTHFSRVFTEATGMTPAEYFQERRVQHGLRLLLEPDRSITEVAHHLGFADLAHFSRVFKQAVGQSPRQYRQEHLA
jgi:AraC-like DNA-binding protein/mannose-6-phosphate isomerase-like protein (cupin superfamily)